MNTPVVDEKTGLVVGRVSRPIPGDVQTIAALLKEAVSRYHEREALVGRHSRYSYGELGEAVASAAATLMSLGIGAGDRVAISGSNDSEMVITFLAVQCVGAAWIGINPALAAPEKLYQIAETGARLYLADPSSAAQVKAARGQVPELERIVVMAPGNDQCDWARLVAEHRTDSLPDIAIDPHGPAGFAFTSGTTGKPKAVVHSQHNMLVVALTTSAGLRGAHLAQPLRQGVTVSLTIMNMQICDVLPAIHLGGAIICMDRRDAIGVAEWTGRERVELLRATPPTIFDILTKPEIGDDQLATLRYLIGGGAGVSDVLRDRYRKRFGRDLTIAYGQTEAPTSLTSTPDEGAPPGSVGRPYAHLEIAILGKDGMPLAPGISGEIAVRAATSGEWAGVYTPLLGYWRRPDATRATLDGGWLHTGDIGVLDAQGNLFLQDRISSLIIRGGANVYPKEVEDVLEADPRVRGAAVIGRPDERLGEVVVAVVELDERADRSTIEAELRTACSERLAKYKIPEEWHFAPALPRNQMNKIIKSGLLASIEANPA